MCFSPAKKNSKENSFCRETSSLRQSYENSQDVTFVNKTPLIGKVNNSKLGIINNERFTVKKVDIYSEELTLENVREVVKKDEDGSVKQDKDGNVEMEKK